jgi:hypothetical protein
MAQVSDPFKAMEIAAAQLENQQTEARTELLETQTLETEARTGLLTAQTEETWKEIETSGGSISKDREIALRGLASLMSSDGYLLLQEDDPEAARAMQFEFMKTFGLVQPTQTQQPPSNKPSADPVPLDSNGKPIVDQSTWDRMPEEDKDLFR